MSDIAIVGFGALSSLGISSRDASAYGSEIKSNIRFETISGRNFPVYSLANTAESFLIESSRESLAEQDRSIKIAAAATRIALSDSGWKNLEPIGVILGSSRGATETVEESVSRHIAGAKLSPFTSPRTTLGNMPTAVAKALGINGLPLALSMTCAGGIIAIANATAWIKSGMLKRALAGGAEAPLTNFTLAQMQALRIYTQEQASPCQPFAMTSSKQNTFALGEGGAVFALEQSETAEKSKILGLIKGFGFGSEVQSNPTSISDSGDAIYRAMRASLEQCGDISSIDAVIAHAPGTIAGDTAEYAAITNLFGKTKPAILSNKFLTGHTFGASGTLSLEYALHLLRGGKITAPAYASLLSSNYEKPFKRILINTAGFGGVAASLIVESTS